MIIKHYKPKGVLENFIESFLFIKTDAEVTRNLFPVTSVILSITFNGSHHYTLNNRRNDLSGLAVTGIRRAPKDIFLSKNTETLLVKFKETGAALFFTQSIHDFFETSVPLTDIYPRQFIEDLRERLAEPKTDHARLQYLQAFLSSRVNQKKPDQLIAAAVEKIHHHHGNLKIQELCRDLNISLDAFEKRFRKIIGTSPKQFCFIVRMKHAIGSISRENGSLYSTAFNLGYFDQTHFIKDFKAFTGQTPSLYLNREAS
jgi:AraC-like DNA-binding protein